MGIDYDAICFYGVYFTYDELKSVMNSSDFKELSKEIGCDDLVNIWEEMGVNYITIRPYCDPYTKDHLFCLGQSLEGNERWCRATGVKINADNLKSWLEEYKNKIENIVKDFCEKYNLEYRDSAFIAFPSIC